MSTNTVSIVSIVSFLSGIALFMCFQIVLYSYYDYLQYAFELVHIDLFSLISNLHPLLVFGFVFTLYQVLSYVLLCSLVRHDFYFGTAVRSNLLGSIFSLGLEISLVNYYSQYGHSTPAVRPHPCRHSRPVSSFSITPTLASTSASSVSFTTPSFSSWLSLTRALSK
uniref:Uncharacterized protein n=1 Tax=Cacopsylla melanoneura TaxID=428564 RepID=A0A8D9A3M7_9HEMI